MQGPRATALSARTNGAARAACGMRVPGRGPSRRAARCQPVRLCCPGTVVGASPTSATAHLANHSTVSFSCASSPGVKRLSPRCSARCASTAAAAACAGAGERAQAAQAQRECAQRIGLRCFSSTPHVLLLHVGCMPVAVPAKPTVVLGGGSSPTCALGACHVAMPLLIPLSTCCTPAACSGQRAKHCTLGIGAQGHAPAPAPAAAQGRRG